MPKLPKTKPAAPPKDESGNAVIYGGEIFTPDQTPAPAKTPATATPPATNASDWFVPLEAAKDTMTVLYYGREGTGKTTAAAHMADLAPEGSKVLVINAEGGVKKSALEKRGVHTSKIVIWPKPGEPVTHEGLERIYNLMRDDLSRDPNSWYGVVFDSITEITNLLLENAVKGRHQRLDNAGRTYNPNLVELDDYGVMTQQARKLIRRFRDLPCHFVVTALERANDDPTRGPIGVGPAVTPAFAADLLGYVNMVLYTRATVPTVGEEESENTPPIQYRALTRPHTRYRAKDRLDVLPVVLANPSFPRILGYVNGELREEEDPLQQEYQQQHQQEKAAKAKAEADKAARKAKAKEKTK